MNDNDNDIDLDLKRVFDTRLTGITPPQRPARGARSRARLALTAGLVTLALVGAGFAFDVNSAAAATGAGCADFGTKVQVWAQAHRADAATDHAAARAELAKLVADSGCDLHDGTHTSPPSGPHH